MMMQLPSDYAAVLSDIKNRIQGSRIRAAVAANREMLRLYYSIGMDLSQRLAVGTYGGSVVDQLSRDLRQAFPETTGFGSRNLRYMPQFAESYPLDEVAADTLQRGVAISEGSIAVPEDLPDLPWRHVIVLKSKVPDRATRAWYACAAIENGWSRDILGLQIDSGLHEREGKAITNFAQPDLGS